MPRITRKEIDLVFEGLCDVMGRKQTDWDLINGRLQCDPESWSIDHSTVYGGYVITQGGGASHPFGSGRLTAYNFMESMRMAKTAAYMMKKKLET